MPQTVLIIIIAAAVFVLLSRKTRSKVTGICAAAIGLDARKQENKEEIIALLAEKGELSNSDIREALGVSATSVVRYMDELEKEEKIEQIGTTGHAVTYHLR